MVSSIMPGASVEFTATGIQHFITDSETPTTNNPSIIINGSNVNIAAFLLISIRAPYDNVSFLQTEALTQMGVSVTPYGFIIYPISFSQLLDESFPSIMIPVKCCGKTGSLSIEGGSIISILNNNYPTTFTVTLASL